MSFQLICYPGCSTCRRAAAWLEARGLSFDQRHIRQQPPTREELAEWQARSGLPLKSFFNTSGQLYRQLGLKDRLPAMGQEEQLALLAGDGMLVRRPILVGTDFVLVGFRQPEWEARLGAGQ